MKPLTSPLNSGATLAISLIACLSITAAAAAADVPSPEATDALKNGKQLVVSGSLQHFYFKQTTGQQPPDLEGTFSLTLRARCLWSLVITGSIPSANLPPQTTEIAYDGTNYYGLVRGAGGAIAVGKAKTLTPFQDHAKVLKDWQPSGHQNALWWLFLSSCSMTNSQGTIDGSLYRGSIPGYSLPYFYQQVYDRNVNSFGPSTVLFYLGKSTNMNSRLAGIISSKDPFQQDGLAVPRQIELQVFRLGETGVTPTLHEQWQLTLPSWHLTEAGSDELIPELNKHTAVEDSRLSPAVEYVTDSWKTKQQAKAEVRADNVKTLHQTSPYTYGRDWSIGSRQLRFGFQEYRDRKVTPTQTTPTGDSGQQTHHKRQVYTQIFLGPVSLSVPLSPLALAAIAAILALAIALFFISRIHRSHAQESHQTNP